MWLNVFAWQLSWHVWGFNDSFVFDQFRLLRCVIAYARLHLIYDLLKEALPENFLINLNEKNFKWKKKNTTQILNLDKYIFKKKAFVWILTDDAIGGANVYEFWLDEEFLLFKACMDMELSVASLTLSSIISLYWK